jgi:SynChlorMet cassette radical SAM/SPASM protein ScmE
MRFSILSNGSLIDDDIASFIAKTKRCELVQVSLDGSTPEVHDSCRGKGSFEGAMRGIRILQRHKVPIGVRVTVHHNNVHDLENIARLILADLKLEGFGTNSAGVFGSCHKNAADVLLTIQDRMDAMETLLRLSAKYRGKISASAGPLEDARRWNEMEKARMQGMPPFYNGGYLTACGCPTNKIAVRSDGTITVCSMLPSICLGRINRDSLLQIWQKSQTLYQFRNRRNLALSSFEFCSGCPYISYCTGNCPASAYNLMGDAYHPSPDACLRQYLNEGGKIPHLLSGI